jgi:hypothetical protein
MHTCPSCGQPSSADPDESLRTELAEKSRLLEEIEATVHSWIPAVGFNAPVDLLGKIRVIRLQAENAVYWRAQADVRADRIYRDKELIHLRKRLWAITIKLRHVRASAVAYKRGKDFELFHRERLLAEQAAALSTPDP